MINNLKVLCIIQARMASTRLPNKVLADLNGKPAIIRMINRVKLSNFIDRIVLATGKSSDNDKLEKAVKRASKIDVFRGDDKDVLSRFVNISKKYNADIIIRLTGDCPLIDYDIIDKAIVLLSNTNSDYVSNILKRTYPDGLDVEVFTADTLSKVNKVSADLFSREHVTTHMHGLRKSKYNLKDIKKSSLENSVDFSHLRWTLDEEKDLDLLKSIYAGVSKNAKWQEVISFLSYNPHLQLINENINTNEGTKVNNYTSLRMRYKKSNKLFSKTINSVPLGSQTFSKSYMQWPKGVAPLFIERAYGAKIVDVDLNHYIDYVMGLLPIILGYCDKDIDNSVINQINKGTVYSLPSILETELSEKLIEIIPSAEMVRFGKNGSDVTTAAIRLARAYTKKDMVAVAGYHGWHDWYIGSSSRNLGVPKAVEKLTKKFIFNDISSLDYLFKKFPNKFAAVILEPAGLEPTNIEFLKEVRTLCNKYGAILIFDEIISGFRINYGGAQKEYGVIPDLSCFGKGIANGYPLSAIVGKKKIMKLMEKIFFSSTFGGETVSLAASIATLNKIEKFNVVEENKAYGKKLSNDLNNIIKILNLNEYLKISNVDWWPQLLVNSHDIKEDLFISLLRQEFLKNGLFLANTFNLCYAHTQKDILEGTIKKFSISISNFKEYISSKNPKKYLQGELIKKTFKVR